MIGQLGRRLSASVCNSTSRPPVGHHLRPQAIGLYKRLHRLGRDYPDPNYHFLDKLRNASRRNAHLTEDADVKKWLDLGEFIYKGKFSLLLPIPDTMIQSLTASSLYSLKKYRTLKRRYNPDS
ncbi:hypothetical protein OC861_001866 [Tilletia horrida]|nr:hypothetical protein OC861_001866 [Tilletia horrida]